MSPNPNITASHINSELNESTKFQVNSIQPQYFLHRDTIKSFFYEKSALLNSGEKALAYFGISLSTLISLCSSTFNDLWIFKAMFFELAFDVAFVISLFLFVKYGLLYLKYKNDLGVEALTDELAKRSTASMISDPNIK